MRRLPLVLMLVVASSAVAGCDGADPDDPLVFAGVEVAPRGDASLAVVGTTLVASGLDGVREGGFTVGGNPQRIDVAVAPVTLPAVGARFGVLVEDAAGQALASFTNELVQDAAGATVTRLRIAFPDGTSSARVTYRLNDAVVFTIPALELRAGDGRLAREASAGETSGKAESVHVVRGSDGRYIVVSDSEAQGSRGGCAGYVLRPPVPLPDAFPDGTLCADWVEVQPLGGPVATAARTSVVGRGVGAFTVRALSAAF